MEIANTIASYITQNTSAETMMAIRFSLGLLMSALIRKGISQFQRPYRPTR